MIIRKAYMIDEGSLSDAGTFTRDIDFTKPITAIDIKIQMTTGAGVVVNTPIPRAIPNISIVDGAFNLFSMIMSAAQSLQFARKGGNPINNFESAAGVVNSGIVRILFGRYYGDREYYLDPTRFQNLQLRITSAFTIGATQYATNTGTVSIMPHIIQEGALPQKGVVMSKEVARPTVVASAVSQVELPTDFPYMGLLYCATDGTVDPDTVIARARLDVNADEVVIEDYRIEDLIQANLMTHGIVKVNNDVFLDWAVSNGIGMAPGTTLLEYAALYGGIFTEFAMAKEGMFYDPSQARSFRLQLTGGSAGGQTRVIANQIYTR